VATLPTTPSGWSFGAQTGTSCSIGVYYKIASGGDAAPTFAALASAFWTTQLAEFTGNFNVLAAVLDKDGVATGTAATETATASAADQSVGELIICAGVAFYSAANTVTIADSINNGTVIDTNNGSTSTANHYSFGYCFSTAHASADANAWSTSTATNLTGSIALVGSFLLGSYIPFLLSPAAAQINSQAINRAANY
jgi:hypothetical protein